MLRLLIVSVALWAPGFASASPLQFDFDAKVNGGPSLINGGTDFLDLQLGSLTSGSIVLGDLQTANDIYPDASAYGQYPFSLEKYRFDAITHQDQNYSYFYFDNSYHQLQFYFGSWAGQNIFDVFVLNIFFKPEIIFTKPIDFNELSKLQFSDVIDSSFLAQRADLSEAFSGGLQHTTIYSGSITSLAVQKVPEPSTILLAAAGLAAVALGRRRSKTSA